MSANRRMWSLEDGYCSSGIPQGDADLSLKHPKNFVYHAHTLATGSAVSCAGDFLMVRRRSTY